MDKIPVASASTESMPMNSSISKVPFSGPFRYTNATSTETDAARNPYWYGGVSSAHPPYLQHLRFLWLGSQDGVIAAFKSGEIDLGLGASADQYWALASVPNSVGYADAAPNWYTEQLTLNNDPTHARGNGLWDPRVREALAMAINKPRLLKVLFPGLNIPPLCGPVATTFWYATIETGCPSYDPAKARQLLAAAGWKPDSKGWESRNGHEMNLLMCTTTGEPERLLTLEKVADYLQAVGIRTRISAVDDNSVLEASWTATSPSTQCSGARGTFDIIDYAPNIVGTPAVDLGGLYASGAWPSKAGHSGTNYAQFSDPLMDQAIFRLRSTVDPTQQLRYAAIAQNEYVKETASISLYDSTLVAGVGARLGNWAGYNPSDVTPTWNVEDWYVKS
jgi:peptide/nickel transport system substrate-binding protein